MSNKFMYRDRIQPELENIRHLISEGYSYTQIRKYLNIEKNAFYNYMKRHPDFKDAVERGNGRLVIKLERALYKEALGYWHTEEHTELIENVDGSTMKKMKKVKKYRKSQAGLLTFALANKCPDKWKRVDKGVAEAMSKMIKNEDDSFSKEAFKEAFNKLYPEFKDDDDEK